jgi:uridine kinase
MAIRVLLDHGIRQEHLIFVTFLVARGGGITMLRRAFPRVKVVCGAVDDGLRETWLDGYDGEGQATEGRKCWVVEPGMGQIGEISFH